MNDLVRCFTIQGKEVFLKKEDLSFRPAAYGLVVCRGRLLLTIVKSTGRWMLPGGGVEIGETLEEALKRETMEECGIEIECRKQLFFGESFFCYEPLGAAWQNFSFFFLCEPKTPDTCDAVTCLDQTDESILPQWVEIDALKEEDFQVFGAQIKQALQGV